MTQQRHQQPGNLPGAQAGHAPASPGRSMREVAPPSRFPWPPVILVVLAASAFVMERTVPTGALFDPIASAMAIAGWLVVVLAVGLDVWAIMTFRRHATTVMPTGKASALITDGPFALTRNPIYLANTMLLLGAGCIWPSLWFMAAALINPIAVAPLAIMREERYLAAVFQDAWSAYCARTRRWI